MSREFKLVKDYYAEGYNLYSKTKVTIESGVTVLVGCNGSGKTTLLHQIKHQLTSENIPFVYFDNVHDGGSNSTESAMFWGNRDFAIRNMISSEGEKINNNMSEIAAQCGRLMSKTVRDYGTELWLLLDAVDSGLSVDNIVDLKEDLFNVMIEDAKSKGVVVYIVVVANEYEVARGEKCLDVYNCKYVEFKDYDDYRNFILKSRKVKDKRFEKKNRKKNKKIIPV